MTTIAYDGISLCSDSRAIGALICQRTAVKINRLEHEGELVLVGLAGDPSITPLAHQAALDFLAREKAPGDSGHATVEYEGLANKEISASCILVCAGEVYMMCYLESFWRFYPEQAPIAVGSGGDVAMGAMLAGATSQQAVRIACKLDSSSGMPVQIFKS